MEIRGKQIRLGIEAPADIVVLREEIAQRLSNENLRAANFNLQEVEQAVNALALKVAHRLALPPSRPESPTVTIESHALGRLTVSDRPHHYLHVGTAGIPRGAPFCPDQ